jgi:hypothetical protein
MEKGFLILIVTFIIVGIIHFISMRTMKLSETKKIHYRKFFWYFYGIIFMLSGGGKPNRKRRVLLEFFNSIYCWVCYSSSKFYWKIRNQDQLV